MEVLWTLKVKPSAKPLLNQLCGIINKGTYSIEIVAHTDNRPAEEKGYLSNWELSAYRGLAVLDYFIKDRGLPLSRFTVVGYSPPSTFQPHFQGD